MLKRGFDIIVASVTLTVASPLLLIVGLFVKLTSPGPVFYRAIRVGWGGGPFTMVKFRTMVNGADRRGPLVTTGGDDRITSLGKVLRKTKIDELPTLWNVVKGEMSLVGPRPENPLSAALYTGEQRRVWQARPGITSLASIKYRNEEALLAGAADLDAAYYAIMQDKLKLELNYVERQSFWLDITIILRTVIAIFDRRVPYASDIPSVVQREGERRR